MDDSLITDHLEDKLRKSLITAAEKSDLMPTPSQHPSTDNDQSRALLGGKEKRDLTLDRKIFYS